MKSPVKKIREQANLTQRKLGQALGFDGNVINRLEYGEDNLFETVDISVGKHAGKKKVGYRLLKEIAEYSNLSFDKLLGQQMAFEKYKLEEVRETLASTDFDIG